MDFKSATDQLMELGLTLPELAEALGVAHTTVRAFRLDPESSSFRAPPRTWREKLAPLARRRGGALIELADQLEGVRQRQPDGSLTVEK